MADGKGLAHELASDMASGAIEAVTHNRQRRRQPLNNLGLVLLVTSLALSGYLLWQQAQGVVAWKTETDAFKSDTRVSLSRIEAKVDTLLLVRGIDPAKVAAATPAPLPSPTPARSVAGAAYAEPLFLP